MKHPGRVSWLLAALLLFSPQLTVLASENAAMESLAESPVVSPAEKSPLPAVTRPGMRPKHLRQTQHLRRLMRPR